MLAERYDGYGDMERGREDKNDGSSQAVRVSRCETDGREQINMARKTNRDEI